MEMIEIFIIFIIHFIHNPSYIVIATKKNVPLSKKSLTVSALLLVLQPILSIVNVRALATLLGKL